MTKYKNQYRVESARLKEWDYSNPWWYYVSINTKNHQEWFGKIMKEKMILNEIGRITENCWLEIPKHFANIELDYYVIMPNHLHGIIIINPMKKEKPNVKTPYMASLPLGEIVGKYKAAVTRWCHQNGLIEFAWQPRFYDHIIRNEKELYSIRKYIKLNPLKWELERETPENLEF